MSRWFGIIDTTRLLWYLSFGPTGRLFPPFPVITVRYLSHEEPLSQDARRNKEGTCFEIFDLSRPVIVPLLGDSHPIISCSRGRELYF